MSLLRFLLRVFIHNPIHPGRTTRLTFLQCLQTFQFNIQNSEAITRPVKRPYFRTSIDFLLPCDYFTGPSSTFLRTLRIFQTYHQQFATQHMNLYNLLMNLPSKTATHSNERASLVYLDPYFGGFVTLRAFFFFFSIKRVDRLYGCLSRCWS